VRAALRYFAACIERVRAVVHSGKRSGTRSWIIVERTPERCGGNIQSEKWSTSSGPTNRSAGGRPARLQIVRQAWANGRRAILRSTGMPSSASATSRAPATLVGAQATSSCFPAATSARPKSEPRM